MTTEMGIGLFLIIVVIAAIIIMTSMSQSTISAPMSLNSSKEEDNDLVPIF